MREIHNRGNLPHIVSVQYDVLLGAAWEHNRRSASLKTLSGEPAVFAAAVVGFTSSFANDDSDTNFRVA